MKKQIKTEVIELEDDPATVGCKFKSDKKRVKILQQAVAKSTTSDAKSTSLKECTKLSSLKSSCCNFRVQLCGKPGLGSTRWFACIRCGKPCDTK